MRRILVSGTTRGLGQFLAEHFLAQGDFVIGCGRSTAALNHPSYVHHQMDVTDDDAVARLFDDVRMRWDALDVLINNAGVASMNAFALTPPASTRRVMDTDFIAAATLTHRAIRFLRKGRGARIVNMTTVAVPLRLEGEAVYAASKAALEIFTRIVAKEVGPMGITCNAVGPSVIPTALTAGVPAHQLDALIQRQAIKREATGSDVANVVDFFLSPNSGLITGQIVYLGGLG
jgi:3-oxoacyl-[acyl-carrier protein] reductase